MSPAPHAPALTFRSMLSKVGAGMLVSLLSACGSGGGAGVVAPPPPVFTSQPGEVTVVVGGKATFAAAASGTPTYQWLRAGSPISGATAETYATAETTAADNNAVFTVSARNGGGATLSAPATLHVNYATVVTPPADALVDAGQSATFSVSAAGSGTLSYQWMKGGVTIPGASTSSYTVPSAGPGSMDAYTCVVASSLNGTAVSVTTAPATLTIRASAAPQILSQPTGLTLLPGAPATFAVTATEGFAFQWYRNGLAIPGATGATYATPPVIAADDLSDFTVAVSNSQGTTTSAAATLRVNYLRANTQPVGRYLAEGAPLTLTADIAASGVLVRQWRKDGVPLVGVTGATYTVASVLPAQAGSYDCVLISTLGGTTCTLTTEPAAISVVPLPVITLQPLGGNFMVGHALTLDTAATVSGGTQLSFQWRKDGVAIAGGTSPRFFIPSAATSDSGAYTCAISNASHGVIATVVTQPAQVVVSGAPVITAQPANASAYEGQPATFTVSAQGPGTLTYQWFRNGTALPGANAATYTIARTAMADDQARFSCTVSNGFPPDAVSGSATLTVQLMPLNPVLRASTQTITVGQGVVFTYLFNPVASGTFGPAGGSLAAVSTGGSTTVYPTASTTYTLTVTAGGSPQTVSVPVTVKTYTPKNLYVINRDSNDLYRYPVHANAALVAYSWGHAWDPGIASSNDALVEQAAPTHVATGLAPIHVSATSDERWVYVSNSGDATLSGYSVDPTTGDLSPLPGSPFALPAGYTKPWCSESDPSGTFLYAACAEGLAVMAIDAATGALTALPARAVAIPGRSQGDLVIHPSGKYLYVTDPGHGVVKSYAIASGGVLTPNGSDMAVTFASGYDPIAQIDAHNPTALTFDRASNLLFTRSTDPLHGDYNGTLETFQVDPFTGQLTSRGASQSLPDARGFNLVWGKTAEFHGLAFSAKPGVDHLFNAYNEFVTRFSGSAYFSEWSVNMDPASPEFGRLNGFFASTYRFNNLAEPYWIFNTTSRQHGGASVVRDRSGLVIAIACPYYTNDVVIYGSDPDGNIAYMGNAIGERLLTAGKYPVHGIFLGTQN